MITPARPAVLAVAPLRPASLGELAGTGLRVIRKPHARLPARPPSAPEEPS